MKYSLCDLNMIRVERGNVPTPSAKHFASLSELEDYMRLEKRAHVASIKKPYPNFVVETPFYISVGVMMGDECIFSGAYSSVGDEFQYAHLLTWLANSLLSNGKLKPVHVTKKMVEIHVDWSSSSHYIAVRKHASRVIEHRYDFREMDWNSRRRLATWIEGHDWCFHYVDSDSRDHLYAGKLEIIHSELIRIATVSYPVPGYDDFLDRVNALKALLQFYSRHPQFVVSLNEKHIAYSIIDAVAPNLDTQLRESASKLLKYMDRQTVFDRLKHLIKVYKDQIRDLGGFMEDLNEFVPHNPVVKELFHE